jgi:hypothetical protein
VVSIAAGESHSLLLKADGTVAACGNHDDWPYSNPWEFPIVVPSGLSNVIAVSGGDAFSLALKADGTVVAWGVNTGGQTNVPIGLSNVVAIAAGARHSLALRADGTVVGWGTGFWVDSVSNVVAVAAGRNNSLVLDADGKVTAWGLAGSAPNPSTLSNVVAIAAGDNGNFSGYISWAVLQADGRVLAGSPFGYLVGPYLSNVVAIAASRGSDHHISLALMRNGGVAALPWGYNFYASQGQPLLPAGLTNVAVVAAGETHNLVLVGNAPPVTSALLVNPNWTTNGFSLSLPTDCGRVYRLEYNDAISNSNWTGLPLVAGNGFLRTLVDASATGAPRYYRVRRW